MNTRQIVTMLALLLAGCGGQQQSTTVSPNGIDEPPVLTMVIVNPDSPDAAPLELAIYNETSLSVDVVLVARASDALTALCTRAALPTVAWLEGLTVPAALAQNCGTPVLQVARSEAAVLAEIAEAALADRAAAATPEAEPAATAEATESPAAAPTSDAAEAAATVVATAEATPEADSVPQDLITGLEVQIVQSRAYGTASLSVISGRTYCRAGVTDLYSWLMPLLIYKEGGIDLPTAAAAIVDYPSAAAALLALEDGTCAATGVRKGTPLPDAALLADASPALPFAVMTVSTDIELGVRLTLTERMPDFSEPLNALLPHDALLPVEADAFQPLEAFLERTRIDLAALNE